MADSPFGQSPFRPPRRRYQFSLATLLLAAIPVGLLAASLGGMLGQGAAAQLPLGYFIVMCIATPLGLVVGASLLHQFLVWWKRRHQEP